MDERSWLAQQFEKNRGHLRGVAYRMLGSLSEADDAVQESWLRLSRSDAGAIQNLSGWLTTVVARVCLDMLRSRTARAEESLETHPTSVTNRPTTRNPEQETLLADSVGVALLVVLDRLKPDERLAFVLHDVFASTRLRRSLIERRKRRASLPAAHDGGFKPRNRTRALTFPSSKEWSTRFSPRCGAETWKGLSRCSIPTYWCVSTGQRGAREDREKSEGLGTGTGSGRLLANGTVCAACLG